jgi:hypothetical protein
MACTSLTQGHIPKKCKVVSGVKEFLVMAHEDLALLNPVVKTAGKVTDINLITTKKFFVYKQRPEVANWKETQTADSKSGTYKNEVSLTFDINSLDNISKVELENLLKTNLVVIAHDNDGTYWLIGEDFGVDVESIGWDSGTAMTDFRGGKVALKCMSINSVAEIDATIIPALLLPAV